MRSLQDPHRLLLGHRICNYHQKLVFWSNRWQRWKKFCRWHLRCKWIHREPFDRKFQLFLVLLCSKCHKVCPNDTVLIFPFLSKLYWICKLCFCCWLTILIHAVGLQSFTSSRKEFIYCKIDSVAIWCNSFTSVHTQTV